MHTVYGSPPPHFFVWWWFIGLIVSCFCDFENWGTIIGIPDKINKINVQFICWMWSRCLPSKYLHCLPGSLDEQPALIREMVWRKRLNFIGVPNKIQAISWALFQCLKCWEFQLYTIRRNVLFGIQLTKTPRWGSLVIVVFSNNVSSLCSHRSYNVTGFTSLHHHSPVSLQVFPDFAISLPNSEAPLVLHTLGEGGQN